MEHKFRAWAVNEKQWIDEDELHLLIPFFSGYEITQDYPHAYVLMEDTCDPGDDGIEKVLEIKWCQFTGCKDKNGKEIYDGDIVHHRDPGGVMSHPGETVFQVKQEESARYLSFGCLAGKNEYDIEVIGNIYENPELKEGGV